MHVERALRRAKGRCVSQVLYGLRRSLCSAQATPYILELLGDFHINISQSALHTAVSNLELSVRCRQYIHSRLDVGLGQV